MKRDKIVRIADALEIVADQTNTYVSEIITVLQGICFDEEEADEIRKFNQDEESL